MSVPYQAGSPESAARARKSACTRTHGLSCGCWRASDVLPERGYRLGREGRDSGQRDTAAMPTDHAPIAIALALTEHRLRLVELEGTVKRLWHKGLMHEHAARTLLLLLDVAPAGQYMTAPVEL